VRLKLSSIAEPRAPQADLLTSDTAAPLQNEPARECREAGNRVELMTGMRSIEVDKRARNEDWLAPKPIPSGLARVEVLALDL